MKMIERMVAPVKRRAMMMISRAVVELVNDATKLQALQVSLLADELRDQVERFQNYGFTSHPHVGAEAIAVGVGGNRDHLVVIAVDDRRYRLKSLADGEVAIYSDEGDKVVLKRGRVIQITAGTRVDIISPNVTMSGNLAVAGNVTVDGNTSVDGNVTSGATVSAATDVVVDGLSFNGHRHTGVDTGSGTSGTPV